MYFLYLSYTIFALLPVPSFFLSLSFLYDFKILIPQFFVNVNFPAIIKVLTGENVQKTQLRIYETMNIHWVRICNSH